jgi:tRNA-binding protein
MAFLKVIDMKDIVDYSNFNNLEIKVGVISDVQDFPRARNPSYKVKVKFDNDVEKWSSAQITNYEKDELVNKKVICITNLGERNIAGFKSQVLILGVPNSNGETILLTPDKEVGVGVQVF